MTLSSAPRRALLKGAVSVLALGGAGTLLGACGGAYTGSDDAWDAPTPTIRSVPNFRDVGGAATGYPTSDGAHVRRGAIYRADAFAPDATDAATLERIGIAAVYDLRTPAETDSLAGGVPVSARYIALNALGTLAPPSFAGMSEAELGDAMRAHWREFVTARAPCAAYGTLLEHLADTPGPQIICGGTGVDVVGWASALLLLIANVPLEIVVKDFLLTDAYRSTGVDAANVAPPVQSDYLQSAFDALQDNYGDLNRYLTVGLGLAPVTVDRLRGRLVV
ncbi:MAG TPA: tyrosine-protein phosphatase [Paraburkholderia sp.]|nr:tyrosine-protein phosphatase [Paraburkholderia sp.]